MSILKRLFGGGADTAGGNGAATPAKVVAERVIDGVKVEAMPIAEGGQFRLCALLSKEIDGEVKTHRLIRADTFSSQDDAVEAGFRKAERVLAEQGDALFS